MLGGWLMNLKMIVNDFLAIYETETGERVVNAQELHEMLFTSTHYNDWFHRNIISIGFIEGRDFYSFLSKTNEINDGKSSQQYILTLDTAKHVAMIQRNEMGMKIRQYFIDFEKKLTPMSIEDLIIMQAKSVKEVKERQSLLEQQNKVLLEKQMTLQHRVDHIDKIDTIGDLQQRLNKMIQKYAVQNGVSFPQGWKDFKNAFNTAFRTNLQRRVENYKLKHRLKQLSMPQYLSLVNRLEDAIRVADKMLNSANTKLRYKKLEH